MTEIIEDLKAIPGVLGACLYHGQKGVLQSNIPQFFKTEKTSEIGKLLMRIHSAGRMNFDDLTDLALHYDESVVMVRELEDNLIIFTLCDPSFNQNLVAMSLNILQQEVKNQTTPLAEIIAEPQPPVDETPAPSPKPVETITEDVAPLLEKLKSFYPKILGPMADLIFDESVETWQNQGGGSLSTIDRLLQLLNEEIGDGEKIERYKEMIAPVLSHFVKES